MAAVLFFEPIMQTNVESGDRLYFYEVGTTTALSVFTDFELSAAHSQPVVADSDGRFAAIYIDATGNDPKVVLEDALLVEKWTLLRYPIEDITTLAADLDTAEAAIVTLAGRVTENEDDVVSLQSESADYESRIAVNESAITALEGSTALSPVAGASFIGENNPVFLQNLGFDSVTKDSEGRFDLTFSVARANANYITVATAGSQSVSAPLECLVTNKTTAGLRVETWYTTGGGTNSYQDRDVNIIVFDLDA